MKTINSILAKLPIFFNRNLLSYSIPLKLFRRSKCHNTVFVKQQSISVISIIVLMMSMPTSSYAVNTQCGVDYNSHLNKYGSNHSFSPNKTGFAALKGDGSITAWGSVGDLDIGAPTDSGYVSIASNCCAFAAMKADGRITAWGNGTYGGVGAPIDSGYISIASSYSAFAALKADGSITVWGVNYPAHGKTPTDSGYISITSNRHAFAAMKADGSITFWWNRAISIYEDVVAPNDSGYVDIVSNDFAFAAMKADGSITAWGDDKNGGVGAPTDSGYISIASSHDNFAALKADGSITVWGRSTDDSRYDAPTDSGYISIASNYYAYAAMKADGSITSWWSASIYLYKEDAGAPTDSGYISIVSNETSFAALKADGSITVWGPGYPAHGKAPTDSGYISITSNRHAFAAMKADGSITIWDNVGNEYRQPIDSGYVSIASNDFAFAAMKADGSITAWGREDSKGYWGDAAPTDSGYISINGVGPNTPKDCSYTPTPITSNTPKPFIKTSDSSKIAIGMDSGSEAGTNSDWWLVANTPSGLYSFDLGTGSWVSGTKVTYQNALFSFDLTEFLNISDLPKGTDTVYFGVDLLKNSALDIEQAHYDSVEVTANNGIGSTDTQVTYKIGDTGPAGGIVFYVTDAGLHGLEAAPNDQGTDVVWGCDPGTTGATGRAVGTGADNTSKILAACSTPGIAARLVSNYVLNDYDDWFLPSKDELNELFLHKDVVGGFTSDPYWSSTEAGPFNAWDQFFNSGYQNYNTKNTLRGFRVRAVRAF